MKPAEYIEGLKKNYTKRAVTAENLSEQLIFEIQQSGHSVEKVLQEINQSDYAYRLLSHLDSRLPQKLRDLFAEGLIAVGEVGDPSPNAYVKSLEGEGYAIIFNSGLRDFLYRIARILSTRFLPQGSTEKAPDLIETARLIAEVFLVVPRNEANFWPSISSTIKSAKNRELTCYRSRDVFTRPRDRPHN
jgi:hypothetical protein